MWEMGKRRPGYVIESALLELCTELSVLAPDIKTVAGPATVKLLEALAAYRGFELTSADAVNSAEPLKAGAVESRPWDVNPRNARSAVRGIPQPRNRRDDPTNPDFRSLETK